MNSGDLKFVNSSQNADVGAAGKVMIRGEWMPQTPEAKKFLAIYSPMFSKFTRAGFLMVGLDLFKKILQSFFLSFIGTPPERSELPVIDRVYERASYDKMDAIWQLVGLQVINGFMLQLLIRQMPYRDRLKNISEIMYVLIDITAQWISNSVVDYMLIPWMMRNALTVAVLRERTFSTSSYR
jgi:hypothetical protein